jgi:hypothetical protein
MKLNQPKKTEEQLNLNLVYRKSTVSQFRSLNELDKIKKIIEKPRTTRRFNCDEQK